MLRMGRRGFKTLEETTFKIQKREKKLQSDLDQHQCIVKFNRDVRQGTLDDQQLFKVLAQNRKSLFERSIYKMLYILVKNNKEQVAVDFMSKVMNDSVSMCNFAALTYPNNLYLFYLYYGQEFMPEKGGSLPHVSPFELLLPVIQQRKHNLFEQKVEQVEPEDDEDQRDLKQAANEVIESDNQNGLLANRNQIVNILYLMLCNNQGRSDDGRKLMQEVFEGLFYGSNQRFWADERAIL